MSGFKKREISPSAVANAEAGAVHAPITGDPRLAGPVPNPSALLPGAGAVQAPMIGAVGSLLEVPLARVKSNPLNPRAIYTAAAVDDMTVSMQEKGQQVAALGFLDDDGNVVLIEGETRLRGARAAGLPTLRIEIRPKPRNDQELYEMARAANVERKDQTPLDDALRWKELLKDNVYPTQAALAKALKVGEDAVSRTLSLSQLPHKIVLAVSEHPELMTLKMLNALREFWAARGDEETFDLIHEAAKKSLGYRDVVARRQTAEKGPSKRPRSAKEELSFNGAKGELKTFEEEGRLELKLQGLSKEDAEKIRAGIKALFPNAVT